MKKALLPLFCIILLSGCANYINKMHAEIDKKMEGNIQKSQKNKKNFGFYRKQGKGAANAPIGLDYTGDKNLSSTDTKELIPTVKRLYNKPQNKRTVAGDLIDNDSDGSLWSGRGQDNFLFSKNKLKKNGDIVSIKIQENLKNDIALELKKAFPSPLNTPAKKEATPKAPAAEGADGPLEATAGKDKVFDRISGVIIEEISNDHILVRGRKDVLFNKSKRTLEVEVLAARTDIAEDDSINSNNALESNIAIIR